MHRRGAGSSLRRWAAVLVLAVGSPADAAPAEPRSAETAPRPKVALVLSGGGARGLAHIGVLKVLRELHVPVDLIVATSMGSIVGGAYAAGRSPEEMQDLVHEADWARIFSDRPPRQDLSFRRKEDDLRLIGQTELGISAKGIVLPRGAIGAQNLEEFLRLVAEPAADARHLDALPVPFRAVATDLVTGQIVVLADAPLSVAMRASMSVPGAFAPARYQDRLLGDGGLTSNLPVHVARELGADVIIAVSVGTPLLPREALSSAFGVAQQMINILTEQNVEASIAQLRSGDMLITPDLEGFTFTDFELGEKIIARGEAAARAKAAGLAPLAVGAQDYATWDARRMRRPVLPYEPVDAVVVRGSQRTNPEALKNEVARSSGIVAGRHVTGAQLDDASRVLAGLGDFERVDAHAETIDGRTVVVLDVDEKPWGANVLRFGGYATSDFHTESRFSIIVQHTRTWLNDWGAEWRNEAQIGDVRRLATSLYQPLGPGSPWFVETGLEHVESDLDLFGEGNRRTDRLSSSSFGIAASLGLRLGRTGVVRLGLAHQRLRVRPLISSEIESTIRASGHGAQFSLTFDALDDANFPRRGYLVNVNATKIWLDADEGGPIETAVLDAGVPVTFGPVTVLGLANLSTSRGDRGGFALGGLFNLSGTPYGALAGSQSALFAAVVYRRLDDVLSGFARNVYAGFSLEAGNAWPSSADASLGFGGLRKAGALFLGIDSVVGPVYAAYGRTGHSDSAFYLFYGRPSFR